LSPTVPTVRRCACGPMGPLMPATWVGRRRQQRRLPSDWRDVVEGANMTTQLVRAATGDTYDFLGLRLRMRLTGQHTAGSLALIEHVGAGEPARPCIGTPVRPRPSSSSTATSTGGRTTTTRSSRPATPCTCPRAASTRFGYAAIPRSFSCSSRRPVSSSSSSLWARPATPTPSCRPYPDLRLPRQWRGSPRYSATTGCLSPVHRRLPDVGLHAPLSSGHRAAPAPSGPLS
jgi:hypothetical protein